MPRPWQGLSLLAGALIAACGGSVGPAPPARYITVPGSPADPGPEPPPAAPSALNGQLWESTSPATESAFRVAVLDDFSFMGWWVKRPDASPPVYGVVVGGLWQQANPDRFETVDMVSMQVPDFETSVATFSVPMPLSAETAVQFGTESTTMHAVPLAQEPLSMAQRSGQYTGELQLPGHREPVNLQWAANGTLTLSLSNAPGSGCVATGQATPTGGGPARLLAFSLGFSGAGCPQLVAGPQLFDLNGLSVSGGIDASSSDAFVLFGSDGLHHAPMVLPATRRP